MKFLSKIGFLTPYVEAVGIDANLYRKDLFKGRYDPAVTDHVKATMQVLQTVQEDPSKVSINDIEKVIRAKGSHIREKAEDIVLTHYKSVANYLCAIVGELGEKHPGLALPSEGEAYGYGLVHDLGNTYLPYEENRIVKELPQYYQARQFGLDKGKFNFADVSMHDQYHGILELIAEGEGIFNEGRYGDWAQVLNDESHSHSLTNTYKRYKNYLEGTGMFFNTLLFVADNIAQKRTPTKEGRYEQINTKELKEDFYTRGRGGLAYYDQEILENGKALPLGEVWMRQGYPALVRSTKLVIDLLEENEEAVEISKKERLGIWKQWGFTNVNMPLRTH